MAGPRIRFEIRQAGRPIVTVLLVWLLLNVAFLALFVLPRRGESRTLEEENKPRLDALAQRKAEVESLEEFLRALQKAENDLVELRTEWLGTRGRRMVRVRLELQRLAERFKINMERVQYQNSELEDEELERFAMVVPLEATYPSLRRFMHAVEASKEFLVIERIVLGQSKQGGVQLELNITLATYFDAPHLRQRKEKEDQERRSRVRRTAGSA